VWSSGVSERVCNGPSVVGRDTRPVSARCWGECEDERDFAARTSWVVWFLQDPRVRRVGNFNERQREKNDDRRSSQSSMFRRTSSPASRRTAASEPAAVVAVAVVAVGLIENRLARFFLGFFGDASPRVTCVFVLFIIYYLLFILTGVGGAEPQCLERDGWWTGLKKNKTYSTSSVPLHCSHNKQIRSRTDVVTSVWRVDDNR